MTTPFICHVEWGTTQPKALETFLSGLFDWQFQAFAPNYLIHMPGDGGVSVGILQSDQAQAGGTPKTSMGSGSFAFVAAPDGNLIGLQKM